MFLILTLPYQEACAVPEFSLLLHFLVFPSSLARTQRTPFPPYGRGTRAPLNPSAPAHPRP